MLREVNPVTARGSRRSFRKHGPAVRATCLLCRVLWPIVVQHRHLPSNYSSEAKPSARIQTSSPKAQPESVATLIIRPA
jgi:hypothetical protein